MTENEDGLDPSYNWIPTDDGSPQDTFIRLAMKPLGESDPTWSYVTAMFCTKRLYWVDLTGNRVPSFPKTHYALIKEEANAVL